MNQEEILRRTSIINVKNKLELKEVYSQKNIIYVRCPFCNSEKGDMKLNTSNNSYICKNCDERGYAIGLYGRCRGISNKDAYKELLDNEADISNNLNTTMTTNIKKNVEELDLVYQALLEKLILSIEHNNKLVSYGFTTEEIKQIGFKTIPILENERIEICRKLIDDGLELEGVPGFYKDKKFRWNFKSHKGFFIPVLENGRIIALRIHLDDRYNTDTTDIWFSSSQENEGAKADNDIMIFYPKNNSLKIINNSEEKKDIIIVSEILLAYKVAKEYTNVIVIRNSKCYYKSTISKIK